MAASDILQFERVSVEVEPVSGTATTLSFDGIDLAIGNEPIHRFAGAEMTLGRTLLYETLLTPNLPVPRARFKEGNRPAPSEMLTSAQRHLEWYLAPTLGFQPIYLERGIYAHTGKEGVLNTRFVTSTARLEALTESETSSELTPFERLCADPLITACNDKTFTNMRVRGITPDEVFLQLPPAVTAMVSLLQARKKMPLCAAELQTQFMKILERPVAPEEMAELIAYTLDECSKYAVLKDKVTAKTLRRNGRSEICLLWQ